MKRIFLIFVSAILCFSWVFVSCDSENSEKALVLASNFAMYDFARAVFGDEAEVEMIIPPETEAHDMELSLADIGKIADAHLVIAVSSEAWLAGALESIESAGGDVNLLAASAVSELIYTDHEHGEADGHDHSASEFDEHIWLSFDNSAAIIRAIAAEADGIDGIDGAACLERAEEYIGELEEIDGELMRLVSSSEKKNAIIADRFPFVYFAERYGLDCMAAFDGCSSDVEPTLAVIDEIVSAAREYGVGAVLVTELSDRKCADAVAEEVGCGVLELHSGHNVTREDFDSGVTFADLMRRNLAVLSEALK